MPVQKIKVEQVEAAEVEVLNTSTNKEKITRIKADDNSNESASSSPFEEILKNNPSMQNNPIFKMMGNIEEIKKIKPYFFFSIVSGIIALFVFREYMGPVAILLGLLDIWKGSKLTRTAAYFGIFLGLVALVLYIR